MVFIIFTYVHSVHDATGPKVLCRLADDGLPGGSEMLHSRPPHSTQAQSHTQRLLRTPQCWPLAFTVLSQTSPHTRCVDHGSLPFTETPQILTNPVRHKGNPAFHFQINPFYPSNHSTSLSPQSYKPKQNHECFSVGGFTASVFNPDT